MKSIILGLVLVILLISICEGLFWLFGTESQGVKVAVVQLVFLIFVIAIKVIEFSAPARK